MNEIERSSTVGKIMHRFAAAALVVAVASLGLAACDRDEGPVEETAEAVDEAAEETGEAIENAADEAEEEAE